MTADEPAHTEPSGTDQAVSTWFVTIEVRNTTEHQEAEYALRIAAREIDLQGRDEGSATWRVVAPLEELRECLPARTMAMLSASRAAAEVARFWTSTILDATDETVDRSDPPISDRLDARRRKSLLAALLSAFPQRDDLESVFSLELDMNIAEYVGANAGLRPTYRSVIERMESRGSTTGSCAGLGVTTPGTTS